MTTYLLTKSTGSRHSFGNLFDAIDALERLGHVLYAVSARHPTDLHGELRHVHSRGDRVENDHPGWFKISTESKRDLRRINEYVQGRHKA